MKFYESVTVEDPQIWAKTFSCMEFMYGVGFVDRMEYNGTIYWKAK